jgi:hypothetical protein
MYSLILSPRLFFDLSTQSEREMCKIKCVPCARHEDTGGMGVELQVILTSTLDIEEWVF